MPHTTDSSWFVTYGGRVFHPLSPQVGDIYLFDIAHALAQLCRFGGHCRDFYSVAQHSVLVSGLVRPDLAKHALMHDAAEAYVGDVIRPVKRALSDFAAIEHRIADCINQRFGLEPLDAADLHEIKVADNRALMTERRDLIANPVGMQWLEDEAAHPVDSMRIVPLAPADAFNLFTARWVEIAMPEHEASHPVDTGKD